MPELKGATMELGPWLVGTGGAGADITESNTWRSSAKFVYVGTKSGSSLLPPLELSHGKHWGVAISTDGKRAVSNSWSWKVLHWNLESKSVIKELEGHTDWIWGIAMTPDGSKAISGSHAWTHGCKRARVPASMHACIQTSIHHPSMYSSIHAGAFL